MKSNRRPRTIEIELSAVHHDYVAKRALEYGSVSKFFGELIRRHRQQSDADRARLEAFALEGLRSGPARRFDDHFFEELRRRIQFAGRRMKARAGAPAKRAERRA